MYTVLILMLASPVVVSTKSTSVATAQLQCKGAAATARAKALRAAEQARDKAKKEAVRARDASKKKAAKLKDKKARVSAVKVADKTYSGAMVAAEKAYKQSVKTSEAQYQSALLSCRAGEQVPQEAFGSTIRLPKDQKRQFSDGLTIVLVNYTYPCPGGVSCSWPISATAIVRLTGGELGSRTLEISLHPSVLPSKQSGSYTVTLVSSDIDGIYLAVTKKED